ncbi:ABC transporter permease [Marinisporobacter balticus]|uniref:Iron(III) transport system permease protein n=1 Tax=Marinisporobacter balticus TaxID=2018667 RepID=A0A4R2KSW0_9FIRM|nr:iron ABC transporter permease [Marinisporobacter balticus]TCO76863.1 iron(III) transport system permease protein [Marinisporobacter balticus]
MKKNNGVIILLYCLLVFFIVYFAFIPVISVIVYGMNLGCKIEIIYKYIERALYYLKNSLVISFVVTFIATSCGMTIAFTLRRLKFRGRNMLRIFSLLPLIHPPFVGSIAFIMLFGRRGLISHQFFGLDISPYGWKGVVFIQVLGLGALANILISSVIEKMDISLEEAARNLGAQEKKVFFTVTLPMMIPEISSTALLVFLASMADFGTPLIIGGDFQTLASDMYIQITGMYNMQGASISGVFLLIPCIFAFVLQRYYIQKRTYFTDEVGAKDIEYKEIKPYAKYLLIFFTSLFIGLVLLKYTFIIIGAFTKQWGYDYTFTLSHFQSILKRDFSSFINSVKLATYVAFISSFIGVVLAYILHNKRVPMAAFVDFMAVLPAAVPGILFGISYLVTFKYPVLGMGRWILKDIKPLVLLGTEIIIYIICIARYMNVGLRAGSALLKHVNSDLEKAAYNLGASETKTFFTVIMPLLKDAFFASFFKNFSTTMTTLGAIIFLLLPKNKVAVQQIFQIITSSAMGEASAMALLLSLLCLIMLGFFYVLFYGGSLWHKMKEGRGVWKSY